MFAKDLEIYNYNRKDSLLNFDVSNDKIELNSTKSLMIVDTLNTNKFKLKIIRFILNLSFRR